MGKLRHFVAVAIAAAGCVQGPRHPDTATKTEPAASLTSVASATSVPTLASAAFVARKRPPPYLSKTLATSSGNKAAAAPTTPLPFFFPLSCASDDQCFTHRCDTTTHACVARCSAASDCGAGAKCVLGSCTGGGSTAKKPPMPFPSIGTLPLPWPPKPNPKATPSATATPPAPTASTPPIAPPAAASADYDWKAHVHWTADATFAWTGDDGGSAFFRDVMTHNDAHFVDDDKTTVAHETSHMLTSRMTNASSTSDFYYYLEAGQGVYVVEPKLNAAKIRDYLPAGARTIAQSRYQTYLVEQTTSWTEVLYQFDEWNAYLIGGHVGVEIVRAGKWPATQQQDVVDGMMDFLYFCSAAVYALRDNERTYYDGNEQFKATYAMQAEATVKWLNEGLGYPAFQGFHAAELRKHFVSSPENEKIRAMLREWYGPTWTQRVFGF